MELQRAVCDISVKALSDENPLAFIAPDIPHSMAKRRAFIAISRMPGCNYGPAKFWPIFAERADPPLTRCVRARDAGQEEEGEEPESDAGEGW